MSKLTQFLVEQSATLMEAQEVKIDGRLKDFKFKILPLSSEDHGTFQKQAQRMRRVGKKASMEFDMAKFNELVLVNNTVEPNFKDAALLKDLGVQTPKDAIAKVLLAGEVQDLSAQILAISGFDTDINEDVEEVKN